MSAYIRYQPIALGGGGGGGGVTTVGTIDSQPASLNGGTILGTGLYFQSASASDPGLVNNAAQTFSGVKTFSSGLVGTLTGSASLNVLTSALGNLTDSGTDGISITGGTGAVVGNVSISQAAASSTQNGYLTSANFTAFNSKQPAGNYITALTGDGTASGPGSAALTLATVNSNVGTFASVTVNGKGLVTAAANLSGDATTSGSALTLATVNSNVGSFTLSNITVNAKGLVTAASSTSTGNLSDTGTDGITITNGSNAVLGSGTTISQAAASATQNGYLSSANFTTFNNKQPAGNYITALTGDVTASGPGSAAATLATVNSNVGSFTNASITVNAKGLITAASSGSASGITSVSVVSANGLAGTSSGGTTPALTLSTTVTAPVLAGNGTAISAASTTGSGSTVVLSTSPTLVTPALGTPSSATLTNATGLPLTSGVTGVLPIANGGTNNGSLSVIAGGLLYTDGSKVNNIGNGTVGQFLTVNAGGNPSWTNSPVPTFYAPTQQRFTSGSGTYSTPSGPAPLYIEVEMVGGGAGGLGGFQGGGGSQGGASGSGGNTTFGTGTTIATAGGASGISAGSTQSASGGTYSLSSFTGIGFNGGTGDGSGTYANQGGSFYGSGGSGASTPFGGAGGGGGIQNAGYSAAANSGSGGGGGAGDQNAGFSVGGPGGAAGGYVKLFIGSPNSTYSYTVGSGGAGGSAGSGALAGGAGAAGIIIVREYYQ